MMKIDEMSSIQKEVWSREEKYWQCYIEKDIAQYMSLWDERVQAWSALGVDPIDKTTLKQKTLDIYQKFKKGEFKYKLKPLKINTFENHIVIVYYKVTYQILDQATSSKIIHTWAKKNEEWLILGGMGVDL